MANPLKKTMVYLGLADEELEYEDEQPQQPAPLRRAHTTTAQKATPVQEMNEILTVHPREYKDAQSIAESFRDGIPVIINLSQMTEGDARRMIDFASGLSLGLYGKIERVTNKVFLLSPAHVAVSGEAPEVESDIEASFFAQS